MVGLYMYIDAHTYIYIYIYVSAHVYIYIYMYIDIHVQLLFFSIVMGSSLWGFAWGLGSCGP